MTDREKAIVMAYTGVCMLKGDKFNIFHQYIEELMGRPVYTHELGFLEYEIREKAKEDFIKLCETSEQQPRNNLAESSQVRITLEEEIMKLDLIVSDAFEGGDVNEFRQLAEWLREVEESREIIDVFLQAFLDFDLDICCEDLTDDDDEVCMENCNNKTKDCWLRWAKLKARERSESE